MSACKAGVESGPTPADEENAAGRKINRKDICFSTEEQYQDRFLRNCDKARLKNITKLTNLLKNYRFCSKYNVECFLLTALFDIVDIKDETT